MILGGEFGLGLSFRLGRFGENDIRGNRAVLLCGEDGRCIGLPLDALGEFELSPLFRNLPGFFLVLQSLEIGV